MSIPMNYNKPTIAIVVFLFSFGAFAGENNVPNPSLTPGDAVPNLTKTDICASDYGKNSHLPLIDVQRKVYSSYHLPEGPMSGYCGKEGGCIINRLIPASLGGTSNPENLWPIPQYSNHWGLSDKNRLEKKLRDMVCSDRISITDAQNAIATDWISTFQIIVGEDEN